jgi:8-amino-7-oxononanoate synthase
LASLDLLQASNQQVKKVQENANRFRSLLADAGLNTGLSNETPIVPVIVGDSELAIMLADKLFTQGISVHPMFYPAVPMGEARLRFFITSEHTEDNLRYATNHILESIALLKSN